MIVVDGFGAIFDYDVMWQSSSRKCYPVRRDSASIKFICHRVGKLLRL